MLRRILAFFSFVDTGVSRFFCGATLALLLGVIVAAWPPGAGAQANFGSVNVGGSTTAIVSVTFASAGKVANVEVLTQGAANLDFTMATGGSCAVGNSYAVSATCTVNVAFAPTRAGVRNGAVKLLDSSGNWLATGSVRGTGVGPQAAFLPGVQSTVSSVVSFPYGIAIDGGGNIYVAAHIVNPVEEILAVNGSIPASPTIVPLGSGYGSNPQSVAVDGSGNVYVADTRNNAIKEILAVNGSIPASPTIKVLGSGFSYPQSVAVDGSGNVYVADYGNSVVKEILAVNGSIPPSPAIVTLGSGFSYPNCVAVDGSGNVFVADDNHGLVKEILAVNGSIPSSPTINTLGSYYSVTGIAVDGNEIGRAHV